MLFFQKRQIYATSFSTFVNNFQQIMDHAKSLQKIKPIHPFAARMAPEIAFEALKGLKKNSMVLDPMVGSGTVLRTVSEHGHNGIGFDIDPLAVLMSKAWTTPFNSKNIKSKAEGILEEANGLNAKEIYLPWIDDDNPTKEFINFWFGKKQVNALRKLSFAISDHNGVYNDLMKVALSRLIITKTKGASLAADVSHSRPHKVYEKNDFDVMTAFSTSCETLAKIFEKQQPKGKINVRKGDARNLKEIGSESVSAIITSPPYLNALDYMRGHKLALVWLGYKIDELGEIRSKSVGTDRGVNDSECNEVVSLITKKIKRLNKLPTRKIKMVNRYSLDMYNIINESKRVLERNGRATFVVGNSCLEGVFIENSEIVSEAGKIVGFKLKSTKEREIPQNRRYLPPPTRNQESNLKKRMRTEVILTFEKK
jgi:tRNA G10  N-methylase Trm11